jgi:predicted PurR-regulated permease PerM
VPYIGPLAGTVPCALLLLLVQPGAALWFVLYIVILQQIESNLIYPRVVGRSVGLPPAWVLAAIVTGGGLFGIAGMLLGVPAAAVLYAVLFPDDAAAQ